MEFGRSARAPRR